MSAEGGEEPGGEDAVEKMARAAIDIARVCARLAQRRWYLRDREFNVNGLTPAMMTCSLIVSRARHS